MRHVPHLYLPGPWEGSTIAVTDALRHHIERVLRRAGGTAITYTDGRGAVGVGTWLGDRVERGSEQNRPPPDVPVFAVAAPRTGDRRRFLVEKLAEIGVSDLRWLSTTRAAARLPSRDKASAWAIGALEQSKGAHLMRVSGPATWDSLPRPLIVADPAGDSWAGMRGATIAVGPEGGFAEGEVPADATTVSVGDRILRVETAAVVLAALVTLASP